MNASVHAQTFGVGIILNKAIELEVRRGIIPNSKTNQCLIKISIREAPNIMSTDKLKVQNIRRKNYGRKSSLLNRKRKIVLD